MRLIGMVLVALTVGCGDSGPEVDPVGSWRFVGESCEGQAITFIGYTENLTIEETSYTGTFSVGGCSVTLSNGGVTQDWEMLPALGSISCAPTPCNFDLELRGPGGTQFLNLVCPDDFPITGSRLHAEVRDGEMYIVSDSGCEDRYIRQ